MQILFLIHVTLYPFKLKKNKKVFSQKWTSNKISPFEMPIDFVLCKIIIRIPNTFCRKLDKKDFHVQICFASRQDMFERTYQHGNRTKWNFFLVSTIQQKKSEIIALFIIHFAAFHCLLLFQKQFRDKKTA